MLAVGLLACGFVQLLNLIGGMPPVAVAFQFGNTMQVGSVFVLATVATRSVLGPLVAHALYDGAVIDSARLVAAGAPPWGTLMLTVVALPMGGLRPLKPERFWSPAAAVQRRETFGSDD